jgi:hypothetical protein
MVGGGGNSHHHSYIIFDDDFGVLRPQVGKAWRYFNFHALIVSCFSLTLAVGTPWTRGVAPSTVARSTGLSDGLNHPSVLK